MEVQLVQLSRVPFGIVTSYILNESNKQSEDRSVKVNEVLISICPTGRLLAFISPFKAQFITCDEPLTISEGATPCKYVNSYEGLLHVVRDPMLPKPAATSCLVVPISFGSRPGIPSQTSSLVIVGFSDGFIRGYSKSGKSVFSQLLHPEPVVSMKVLCQPPSHGLQSAQRSPGSLIVLLRGNVACIVIGDSLTEIIKNNITRTSQEGYDPFDPDQQQTPLDYKKFYLQDQSTISDISLIGQSTMTAFDYLREASVVGGWNATIRSGPVPEAKLLTVGEQPMVALYRLSKDAGTLNMSEVVHAVATRMTSAVLGRLSAAGGWLNWGGSGGGGAKATSQTPTKGKLPEEKQQPKMNLQMSTNIPDPRRHVTSIVVSPNGHLATLVDGFGRVMLLDVGALVIRRIWKGYRDAQCGWLRVTDPSEANRHVQCMCVYAPRRGILEFWPVQSGPRVAAFQVGKGCRLLHVTNAIFGDEGDTPLIGVGIGDKAILLTNDGRLLTFTVPFPLLVKRSSPRSHDSHMLLTLNQAIANGDEERIFQVTESVKSSHALQEVLKFILNAFEQSDDNISRDTLLRVLDIAVLKTKSQKDFTVPEELHNHCLTVRQLVKFYLDVIDLSEAEEDVPKDDNNTLSQFLQDHFGLAFHFSERLEILLSSYFKLNEPVKRVRQVFQLTDLINCFEIHNKPIDCLLPSYKTINPQDIGSGDVPTEILLKKDVPQPVQNELAEFIFKRVLSVSIPYHKMESVFKHSPIHSGQIMILLYKYWISGGFHLTNVMLSVTSLLELSRIFINKMSSTTGDVDPTHWDEVMKIVGDSYCPGHALLVTIFCNHLSVQGSSPIATPNKTKKISTVEDSDEDYEEDQWETISFDGEKWARLIELLELLTELSLVIGRGTLTPAVPVVSVNGQYCEEYNGKGTLNVTKMKIKMEFGDDGSQGGMSVSTLNGCGPSLLGHTMADSIVSRRLPAGLIIEMDTGASQNILHNIRTLHNALPESLSVNNILVYCGFQGAMRWSECEKTEEKKKLLLVTLDYITRIQSLSIAEGVCGFLWHSLLEKELTSVFESLKKRGSKQDGGGCNLSLIWVCRSLITFLLKSSLFREEGVESDERTLHDVINIDNPPDVMYLPGICQCFPSCLTDSLTLWLQLLLLVEILASCEVQTNVFSFFPSSFQSTWSKGLFNCDGRTDVVQKNMQIKRMKFLTGAVSTIINDKEPSIKPNANFIAIAAIKSPQAQQYDYSDYRDLVFGLAHLWDMDIDHVKTHWAASLFAAGKDEMGKQVYHSIVNKDKSSEMLLSLAGHMTLKVINEKDRQVQGMLLAQSPPGIMEWMKRQASHSTVVSLSSVSVCTSVSVLSNLLNTIGPQLTTNKTYHNINNILVLIQQL